MTTIEDINQKIKETGAKIDFLVKSDINSIPGLLSNDEVFENVIQGIYNKRHGILVSTNKRLIFIHKKLIGGITVEDFPLSKISSIQYNIGLIYGDVKIFASGNTATIEHVNKSNTKTFCEQVKQKIA